MPGMARGSDRSHDHRAQGSATLPVIRAMLLRAGPKHARFEIAAFPFSQGGRGTSSAGNLFLFALISDRGLQRPADSISAAGVLLRPGAIRHFETSFAIFHQRYSTNTQPSWSLAQPFRFVAHNGEINTISANRRWLRAKATALLPGGLQVPDQVRASRRASQRLGQLRQRSRTSAAPRLQSCGGNAADGASGVGDDPQITPDLRHFLEEHARCRSHGTARRRMVFTDGCTVGAKLDRNGLRPLRYTLTTDGLLVVGSEVGIADLHGKEMSPNGSVSGRAKYRWSAIPRAESSSGPRKSLQLVRNSAKCLRRRQCAARCSDGKAFARFHARCRSERWRLWVGAKINTSLLFQPLVRAGTRSGVEHGRRRAAGLSCPPAAAAVGLLQAALRASHESAHRSACARPT